LCGEKLAITSSKPQTTRNRILGVVHRPDSQAVFLDTPGMHETDRAINRYMQQVITKVTGDVDILVYIADATRTHGREDSLTLSMLPEDARIPVILAVNKSDLSGPGPAGERVVFLKELYDFTEAFIISARTGAGTEELLNRICSLLPEGVPYFPEDMVTDQPLGFRLAEIVREKLFDLTREEVPYSTAVVVDGIATREDGLMEIGATIFVEKESQKGIVIGKRGAMLQQVGSEARSEMEDRLGRKIYLNLWVKVKKGWTDRESLLRQMGYE